MVIMLTIIECHVVIKLLSCDELITNSLWDDKLKTIIEKLDENKKYHMNLTFI
jgi:hypothetical protein